MKSKHHIIKTLSWACFAATGREQLAVIESAMNSSVYQSVVQSNVKLGETRSYNRTMISSTTTNLQEKKKRMKVFQCLSQSSDLSPVEIL